jgi:hypothetical protein
VYTGTFNEVKSYLDRHLSGSVDQHRGWLLHSACNEGRQQDFPLPDGRTLHLFYLTDDEKFEVRISYR